MGQYLSADIMYGYKLGGAEEEWDCYPTDPETYGTVWPSWVKLDNEDPDYPGPDDFGGQIEDRLIEVLGNFTEPEPEVDWSRRDYRNDPNYARRERWHERQAAAKKAANIGSDVGQIGTDLYGVSDYSGYVLGVKVLHSGESLTSIPLDALDSITYDSENRQAWDRILAKAVAALEIQPKDENGEPQKAPKLYILAYYG